MDIKTHQKENLEIKRTRQQEVTEIRYENMLYICLCSSFNFTKMFSRDDNVSFF